jgi:hypothetical protein
MPTEPESYFARRSLVNAHLAAVAAAGAWRGGARTGYDRRPRKEAA